MAQTTLPTNNSLLEQLAKAFIAQNLDIDPKQWGMTKDQAWVSLAARLLNKNVPSRHVPRHRVSLTNQNVSGGQKR